VKIHLGPWPPDRVGKAAIVVVVLVPLFLNLGGLALLRFIF
jgi:hypothetical protein